MRIRCLPDQPVLYSTAFGYIPCMLENVKEPLSFIPRTRELAKYKLAVRNPTLQTEMYERIICMLNKLEKEQLLNTYSAGNLNSSVVFHYQRTVNVEVSACTTAGVTPSFCFTWFTVIPLYPITHSQNWILTFYRKTGGWWVYYLPNCAAFYADNKVHPLSTHKFYLRRNTYGLYSVRFRWVQLHFRHPQHDSCPAGSGFRWLLGTMHQENLQLTSIFFVRH